MCVCVHTTAESQSSSSSSKLCSGLVPLSSSCPAHGKAGRQECFLAQLQHSLVVNYAWFYLENWALVVIAISVFFFPEEKGKPCQSQTRLFEAWSELWFELQVCREESCFYSWKDFLRNFILGHSCTNDYKCGWFTYLIGQYCILGHFGKCAFK